MTSSPTWPRAAAPDRSSLASWSARARSASCASRCRSASRSIARARIRACSHCSRAASRSCSEVWRASTASPTAAAMAARLATAARKCGAGPLGAAPAPDSVSGTAEHDGLRRGSRDWAPPSERRACSSWTPRARSSPVSANLLMAGHPPPAARTRWRTGATRRSGWGRSSSMGWRRNALIASQCTRAASTSGSAPGAYAPTSMSSRASRCAASTRRSTVAAARCSGVVTAPATRETDSRTSMVGKCPAVASRRDSVTCPSRMERAASAIGSLWSSPSTSTV